MLKVNSLSKKFLKKLYSKDINVNEYLRKNTTLPEEEIIKLSYDVQSGSYVTKFTYFKSKKILNKVIKQINSTNYKSLIDFGCGELTNSYTILCNINIKNKVFFGYDLSLSRILEGKKFLDKKKKVKIKLFSTDFINIPLPDNSVDIVLSCHSLEPNKKNAYRILKELWRIAKKKLILLEPDNNLGNKLIKKRFVKHNYVLNLEKKIKKITLNYKIIDNVNYFNDLNPSSVFIIEKNTKKNSKLNFLNPNDKNDILKKKKNFYYSQKHDEKFLIRDDIVIFNKK